VPIIISIPRRSLRADASDLSSRKLLDIASDKRPTRSEIDITSAIVELKTRRHYLKELVDQGLLNEA
jgi:hypothetical protein